MDIIANQHIERETRVAFLPYFEENPYQEMLSSALSKQGIGVIKQYKLRVFLTLINRIKVIHLHWLPVLQNKRFAKLRMWIFCARLLVLRLFGVQVVWTLHNLYSHDSENHGFEKEFVLNIARICNRVIVHTYGAKNAFEAEFGSDHLNKMKCIPHGSYINVYPRTVTKKDARERLGYSNEKILLFFGNIKPYKGIDILIKEFKKINFENARLLIVGKPDSKQLKKEIEDSAKEDTRIQTVFSYVPEEDVQVYFHASDAVVFPYRDILTSGAVILAMSFGKPCIIVDKGCMRETMHPEGGTTFSSEQDDGLYRALHSTLLKSTSMLEKMGEYNYTEAEGLNWEKIAKQTANAYDLCQ
ncbi:glycosyltransferase [Microbulbifer sp. ALW1]|uniref:glycosyltransferase n=1 Tax=Microbulbifer sp. (strain ALW1) TaxID=1516059 RepID=UPI0013589410|nr:glycosyltransferase [Microbulbifer sp. ALW1]